MEVSGLGRPLLVRRDFWEDASPPVLIGAFVCLVVIVAAWWWSARGGRLVAAARRRGYAARARAAAPDVPSALFVAGPRVTSYVDARSATWPFVSGVAHVEVPPKGTWAHPTVAFLAVPDAGCADPARALAPLERRLAAYEVEVVPGWVVVRQAPATGNLLQDLDAIEALARKLRERLAG
jgi:hypothetical protein